MGRNKKNRNHPMVRRSQGNQKPKPARKQNKRKDDSRREVPASENVPSMNTEMSLPSLFPDVRPGPSREPVFDLPQGSLGDILQSHQSSDMPDSSYYPYVPPSGVPAFRQSSQMESNLPMISNQAAHFGERFGPFMMPGNRHFPHPQTGFPSRTISLADLPPGGTLVITETIMRIPASSLDQFRMASQSTGQVNHGPQMNPNAGNFPMNFPPMEPRPSNFFRPDLIPPPAEPPNFHVHRSPLDDEPPASFIPESDEE